MMRHFFIFLLALAAVVAIWLLPLTAFRFVLLVVTGIGLWELAGMSLHDPLDRVFAVFFGLGIASLLIWVPVPEWVLGGLALMVFLLFLWGLLRHEPVTDVAGRFGAILLGGCYLGLTLPFWVWLRKAGSEWVMLALLPACLTDTFAMFAGKAFGRHKIVRLSPNKTLEGYLGGLVGGIVGLWLARILFFPGDKIGWALALGLGVGIAALVMIGDLCESLLKRSYGRKDSSHLIPDHGGMLDRLDAMVFVAPFFYLMMRLTGIEA